MKEILTSKRVISVMSLLLAIVMMFSACGGNSTASSEIAIIDTESDTDVVASEKETTSKEKDTSSNKQNSSKANKTEESGSATFAADPYSTMSADLKGKEVHVLMWRDYTPTEKKLVDGYTANTGVKVRTTVTTENEYSTKLISLVSGKDSPDVVCFSAGHFPGLVTKSMQPLSQTKFKLDDACWNKDYMDYYKINGKYFGVAMRGTWSCEDCNYVTYYNPQILRDAGITQMPYDHYTAGSWNWDTQATIANAVAAKGLTGISFQSQDLVMLSSGADFVTYDGSQYTSTLGSVQDSSMLTKSWQVISQFNTNKVISGWDITSVQQGKVGLFTAIAYGLYNEGAWFDNVSGGYANLQAVPVAGPAGAQAYTPVRPKVWGVAKGAKNAEGAAYFLRYFLDTANCDMNSTFYNAQFKSVYDIITAKGNKKAVRLGSGVIDYVKAGTYDKLCNTLANTTAANITTVLNQQAGTIKTGIDRANKDLKRIKAS